MRHEIGTRVRVFASTLGCWFEGTVVCVWAVSIPAKPHIRFQYDVDGKDSDGPFYGTWDDENVVAVEMEAMLQ